MMRRSIIIVTIGLTLLPILAHCRGASGLMSINNLSEGEGGAFQVLDGTASAALVKGMLLQTEQLFTMGLERSISVSENAAATQEVCQSGTTSMTVDPMIIDNGDGTATVSGWSEASKTGNDAGTSALSLTTILADYAFHSSLADADFTVTGTTTYRSTTDIDTGLTTICNATTKSDIHYSGSSSVTVEGGLSLTGDYGAAISFTMTTTETTDAQGAQSMARSGSAAIKSNGQTAQCLIYADPVGDTFDAYVIDCGQYLPTFHGE